jgi:hypothetical protein
MRLLAPLLCSFALAATAAAQSPLTTLFAADDTAPAGSCIYFDLTVTKAVTISQIDINTVSLPGTPGSVQVWVGPETWVGKCTQPGLWTQVTSGPVVSADIDNPTPCILTQPFTLAAGTYAVALRHVGVAPAFTDGTGSNETWFNNDITLHAGAVSNGLFAGALHQPRVFNGAFHYTLGGTPLPIAVSADYGRGCNNVQGTFYENFPVQAWVSTLDLDNSTVRLIPNAQGGYSVTKAAGAAIVPPGVPPIPLGDDTISIEYTPFMFPYPGGVTNNLWVCSNGFIGFEPFSEADFLPTTGKMLSQGARLMPAWMDFNPGAIGSGKVHYEIDPTNTFVTITWNNVWQYGSLGFMPSRFQVVLRSNGEIEMRYGLVYCEGASCIVGYTPGNGNLGMPGTAVDLSAPASFATGFQRGLVLHVDQRPVLGSTLTFRTDNIPANAIISTNMIGLGAVMPGLDLTALGAPGCSQYVIADNNTLLFGSGSQSTTLGPLPTDPVWIGLPFFNQSASLVPGANTLGVLTSNGNRLVIGGI